MRLFRAVDGSLINPSCVNFARKSREANKWVVKFDFGTNARDLLFDYESDADNQIQRFYDHCDSNEGGK